MSRAAHEERVRLCYSWFHLFRRNSVEDLTEGIFGGDETKDYEEAQRDQRAYLLDQAGVASGVRLLDVGCGYGQLLAEARSRGARPVGITLSPAQARSCRRERSLEVHVTAWQDLGEEWDGRFDAIVANGSLEHYVSIDDARAGRQDGVYRRFFSRCHRLLDPRSKVQRLAIAAVHFRRRFSPERLGVDDPNELEPLSDEQQLALVAKFYGGWYPQGPEHLAACAEPHFALCRTVDGTDDYRITNLRNEELFRRGWGPRKVLGLVRLVPLWWRDPGFRHRLQLLRQSSWAHQFKGDDPPCGLMRLTFEDRRVAA